jgi:hypothetical protein
MSCLLFFAYHFIDIFDVCFTSFVVKDRQPLKSSVIGRPVLVALEDVDGAPSFLEKALRFIEEYGGSCFFHYRILFQWYSKMFLL